MNNTEKSPLIGKLIVLILLIALWAGSIMVIKPYITSLKGSATIVNNVKAGDIGKVTSLVEGGEKVGDSTVVVSFNKLKLHYKAKSMDEANSLIGKKVKVISMPKNPDEYKINELKPIK